MLSTNLPSISNCKSMHNISSSPQSKHFWCQFSRHYARTAVEVSHASMHLQMRIGNKKLLQLQNSLIESIHSFAVAFITRGEPHLAWDLLKCCGSLGIVLCLLFSDHSSCVCAISIVRSTSDLKRSSDYSRICLKSVDSPSRSAGEPPRKKLQSWLLLSLPSPYAMKGIKVTRASSMLSSTTMWLISEVLTDAWITLSRLTCWSVCCLDRDRR